MKRKADRADLAVIKGDLEFVRDVQILNSGRIENGSADQKCEGEGNR